VHLHVHDGQIGEPVALIICLWLVLFLEIVRWIAGIRSGVKAAKTAAKSKTAANLSGCVVVVFMTAIFWLIIAVLIWAIVALNNLQ
jgi:hypothetical protein